MKRGNTALTTRQTFITNLATTQHCVHHCFQYLSFLNLCSFERGAAILTLGSRESRRKILSEGYWGEMQRFNDSSLLSPAQSWGRWEMAASDQSEAEMGTRRPIRGQHGDTDSTEQTQESSHQREKLGDVLISSHHLGIFSQIKLEPHI